MAADANQLRIATVAPAGSSFHKRLQSLGAEWARGPGGVAMNIYAGTQGGEPQIVRRMRVGQLQGAMLTAVGLSQIDPSVTALQYLPLMFHDWDDVDRVRERLQPDLEARLRKAGFVVMLWADAGWVRYFSRMPIHDIDDLKSMRVYASSGNPETVEIFKEFYTPVVLEPDQILLGLRNNMIDAVADTAVPGERQPGADVRALHAGPALGAGDGGARADRTGLETARSEDAGLVARNVGACRT